MQFELRVYHEHQSSQLCARHCLNNLLQGPYFTEFDLSQIALELDKQEQALLAKDGDDGLLEWLKHNKESQNVSMDGNFSVQVLRKALDNLGLTIIHFGHSETSDAQQHPENETGFICNLQAHWFSVRKMAGQWYDLNSLSGLPETNAVPTTISNFYLSAFLSTLTNDGYSIFVVRGTWPHLHSYDPQQLLPKYCNWRLAKDIKVRNESYDKKLLAQVNKSRNGQQTTGLGWGGGGSNNNNNYNNQGNMNNNNDQLLKYAIAQSLEQNNNSAFGASGGGNALQSQISDPELAHALALSMSDANKNNNNNTSTVQTSANNNNNNNMAVDEDDDSAMLQQALAMSMADDGGGGGGDADGNVKAKVEEKEQLVVVEEPSENDNECCKVRLRLSQNQKEQRRFNLNNSLKDVAVFCKSKDNTLNIDGIVFVCPPDAQYSDLNMELKEICETTKTKNLSFIVKCVTQKKSVK